MAKALQKTWHLYRNAYSGHPQEVWSLVVLTFINRMGTMVLPFLSVYLTTVLGFSLKVAGLLTAGFGIGSLIGSYIGGRLSDRFHPNYVIIASMLMSGILFIILQFAQTTWSFFFLIMVTASFGEAYRPAMTTAVSLYVPKHETGRTMSLIRLAINLGFSMAPVLGGFVAATIGYQFLFWIDGLTCFSAGVFFWINTSYWKRKARKKPATESIATPTLEEETLIKPYQNKNYLIFLISTFCIGFAFVQWFYAAPVYIKSDLGFDERYIGILLGSSSLLIILIEMPLVHAIEKAQLIGKSILWGMALIALSYLSFLISPALLFSFIAIYLWTMGEILLLPFNVSIPVFMSQQKNRGEYMAWYWMTWSIINICGPSIGLPLAEELGFLNYWIIVSVIGCIGFVLLYINKKRIILT